MHNNFTAAFIFHQNIQKDQTNQTLQTRHLQFTRSTAKPAAHSQAFVNGEVRVKLYKGNVDIAGRKSNDSLFDEKIATFEEDDGAYDQADAEGFIRRMDTEFGAAGALAPPYGFAEMDACWDAPPTRLGAHPPVWD